MDVSDLKVSSPKSTNAWTPASTTCAASWPACAPAGHPSAFSTRTRRGLRRTDAAQSGGLALDTRADADRRAALRPIADGTDREGDPRFRSGLEPDERRQGHPHSDPGPHRGAAQGALPARAQAWPRRAATRVRTVRRDANEQLKKMLKDHLDLRRRREARARRSAEDHRSAHQVRSTTCRRRRTRSCWGTSELTLPVPATGAGSVGRSILSSASISHAASDLSNVTANSPADWPPAWKLVLHVLLHPSGLLASLRRRSLRPPRAAFSLPVRRPAAAGALRSAAGARLAARLAASIARRTCGAIAR